MPRLAPDAFPVIACALGVLGAAAAGGGCALRPAPPFRDTITSGPINNPFVPASMIIHPLTRVDNDSAGKLWVYCHIEFKDSWGDTVKSVGTLQVQLYRPTGPRASGLGRQELVWKINLSDLEQNAGLYDPATRTYRLPLENPPAWLAQPPVTPDLPRARLHAILTTPGPRGGERTLEDEFAF